MVTWEGGDYPDEPKITPLGWGLVVLRGLVLAAVVFGGLALLLTLRLIERPIFGLNRPWTPWITQGVCRAAFVILGMGFSTSGQPMKQPGAAVANHGSWLDIFALNARKRIYFVSKSEVANWPGIGWLARATGTVFINRDRREAKAQTDLFMERIEAGHRLVFFPEGTSTDASRVIPFKTTLFEAFFRHSASADLHIQPITLAYHAPPGADPRHYGWWGDMSFGAHLLKVLATPRQGRVAITYHPPVRIEDFENRKALARHLETIVRNGLRAAFPERQIGDS
ncbi:lysophospholipid acyltransferase family protein [Mesobacterium pallidum]|uniref:lysophospholipid acyltransferase family protein n=1 Tax=Mesobacterium pallidum TaxID=2872037 RepID=UPI001EE1716E|nr:lysophospholipid acyltransferase family protein [Mesobacterium pallidum]